MEWEAKYSWKWGLWNCLLVVVASGLYFTVDHFEASVDDLAIQENERLLALASHSAELTALTVVQTSVLDAARIAAFGFASSAINRDALISKFTGRACNGVTLDTIDFNIVKVDTEHGAALDAASNANAYGLALDAARGAASNFNAYRLARDAARNAAHDAIDFNAYRLARAYEVVTLDAARDVWAIARKAADFDTAARDARFDIARDVHETVRNAHDALRGTVELDKVTESAKAMVKEQFIRYRLRAPGPFDQLDSVLDSTIDSTYAAACTAAFDALVAAFAATFDAARAAALDAALDADTYRADLLAFEAAYTVVNEIALDAARQATGATSAAACPFGSDADSARSAALDISASTNRAVRCLVVVTIVFYLALFGVFISILSSLLQIVPQQILDEQLGDLAEFLFDLEAEGASPLRLKYETIKGHTWLLINTLREVVVTAVSRKTSL